MDNYDLTLDLLRRYGPVEKAQLSVIGQIGRSLGLTNRRAHQILERLAADGLVALEYGGPRTIVRAEALPTPDNTWDELERLLGVHFNDRSLLERAFTHDSFVDQSRPANWERHNQGLEFLGDSVLDLVVREFLFTQHPEREGTMTARTQILTTNEVLEDIADSLGIVPFLRHGTAYHQGNLAQRFKADLVEALLAAIYLDQGLEAVRAFVYEKIIEPNLQRVLAVNSFVDISAKIRLQALFWSRLRARPIYRVIKSEGSPGNVVHTVGVYYEGRLFATGTGASPNRASEVAAQVLLDGLGEPE